MNLMENKQDPKTTAKKQGWFGKLFEKLDKKMENKARECCCCNSSKENSGKGSSCC